MRSFLLLGLFLGLFASAASAQVVNPDPQGLKQRLRGQYLSNDTAQAIINLYSRRQAGGASWMVAGALSALRIATAGNNSQTVGNGYVVQDNSSNTGVVFLVATPFLGYGLSKILRFSNGNLEQALTAYTTGQHLPKSLRRKLKPRFFSQPIVNYKPVPVKPAN